MGKIEEMKAAVLSLAFLVTSVACYGQDDLLVYKEVIDRHVLKLRQPNIDYSSKTTITVLAMPTYNNTPGMDDYAKFKDKYRRLSKEAFIDFVSKSTEAVPFEKIIIPNIEFVVLKSDSTPKHADLATKYRHWIYSIVALSNVGMNREKSQALIYYSFDSGPGVGGGVYIIYEKNGRRWKQKAVIPAWAA
jgi:hypothetical protein